MKELEHFPSSTSHISSEGTKKKEREVRSREKKEGEKKDDEG